MELAYSQWGYSWFNWEQIWYAIGYISGEKLNEDDWHPNQVETCENKASFFKRYLNNSFHHRIILDRIYMPEYSASSWYI